MTKFHEKLNRSRVHVQAKMQENLLIEKSFNTSNIEWPRSIDQYRRILALYEAGRQFLYAIPIAYTVAVKVSNACIWLIVIIIGSTHTVQPNNNYWIRKRSISVHENSNLLPISLSLTLAKQVLKFFSRHGPAKANHDYTVIRFYWYMNSKYISTTNS